MNHFIIQAYINKLTKQDIINYLKTQKINISEKELDIIYNYLKTKTKEFLKGNREQILKELQQKLSTKTYKIIEEYYNSYKDKI